MKLKAPLIVSYLVVLLLVSCKTTKNTTAALSDAYLFETVIPPNTLFKTHTEQQMDLTMKMSGKGMPAQPMTVKSFSDGATTMTTGSKNAAGLIPLLIAYDSLKISSQSDLPGVEQPESPDFSNGKIHCHYDGSSIVLDSITGINAQLSNQMEQFSQAMFENLNINFPESPIHIGDSFSDVRSIDIPMQGVGVGTMNFNTNYTLEKVNSGMATFNTVVELSGSISISGEESPINGSGTGTTIIDMEEKYANFSELTLTQNMSMKMQGMSIGHKSMIHSKNEVRKQRLE